MYMSSQSLWRASIVVIAAALLNIGAAAESRGIDTYRLTRDEQAALNRISILSMQGNLSFLASDALQGRGTPSVGLDVAAQYIAERFRLAGLESIGDDGYFQTADWIPPRRRAASESTSQLDAAPPAKVRNVAGLLRGSDANLADTFILVTAHYDHLGVQSEGTGDLIFNGATDDGSGVVSVIELATVLATLKERPKRSIVFMTYYGEEKGLVGSRYYGAHPLVPIDKTIANINIEQVGRADDSDHPGRALAFVTGMDYSDIGSILEVAGKLQRVRIFRNERNSDSFFPRSDNRPLADLGVPAHTISSSYAFPDAHRVSDHEDRIDYENMAHINRALALAILMIANADNEPQWSATNPKAAKYEAARKSRLQAASP
jgi:Zn-dependent M28 family amino/carboxypeptidase